MHEPAIAKDSFGLDIQELAALVEESGQPAYRARQLFQALYRERVSSTEQITTLPKEFRAWLSSQGIVIGIPLIENQFGSTDGTIRYLVRLSDHETIETVWMPEGDDGESGDGTDAETRVESGSLASRYYLRLQPGRLCGELPVLPHGNAGC